ncbi:MAG: response regulator, partial [Gammaproteobacteria bacterium]|nr:response regulator [Gammaproteobacteria bacterium]
MSSKHILVVEDDSEISEMLRFSQEKSGYAVVEAEDADMALEKLGVMLPDVMLVDWMLPGMNGPEFVRRTRRDDLTK